MNALTVAGLALIVVGVILVLAATFRPTAKQGMRAKRAPESTGGPAAILEAAAKLLEQAGKLLDRFDKPVRPGLFLVLLGVALVILGGF